MSANKKRNLTTAMFMGAGLIAAVAAYIGVTSASPADHRKVDQQLAATPKPMERPKVDVVFVLDTTSSMSGLIEGAKQKIWSIANQVLDGNPRPDVRFGLIGYRDRGDSYVTKRHALTENIDDVQANLRAFRAAGGGDYREHVNKALYEAIHHMQWRRGKRVLRQIFLVGDAPPHEGRDGLHSSRLAMTAKTNNIIINAVRCGQSEQTKRAWLRVANSTGGMFATIAQNGGMVAISTPLDKRLQELNGQLSLTLLAAGDARDKAAAKRRLDANKALGGFGAAESAKYRAGSGMLDSTDLLTRIKRGRKLRSFKPSALPAKMATMDLAQRARYVKQVAKKRAKLKEEIRKLAKKRDSYIKRKSGGSKGFDGAVGKALKTQGKVAHIKY